MIVWPTLERAHSSFLNRNGNQSWFRVLCYHGVVERKADLLLERNFHLLSDFKAQLRILRRRFRILSLPELASEISTHTGDRRPRALITFDDGYANNLLAGELLAEFGLPWTVFVATGALGRKNSIWAIELALLLLHGQLDYVDALGKVWSLKGSADRQAVFQAVRGPMKLMPSAQRQPAMNSIREQFPVGETERLLNRFPSQQMLSWEEIAQLAGAGVEIGSHGVNHEVHHSMQPESVRVGELVASKSNLESELKRPCRFFAYPNGDFISTSADEVCAAGFELAFTTLPGMIKPESNPYLLPRLYPNGSTSRLRTIFRNDLSGTLLA